MIHLESIFKTVENCRKNVHTKNGFGTKIHCNNNLQTRKKNVENGG